jgi:hypothetical protein
MWNEDAEQAVAQTRAKLTSICSQVDEVAPSGVNSEFGLAHCDPAEPVDMRPVKVF